jgi:hypothetical protein
MEEESNKNDTAIYDNQENEILAEIKIEIIEK